jgi:hypothetical protein
MEADIKSYLESQELYHSVLAVTLDACLGRVPQTFDNDVGQAAADRLLRPEVGALPLQPTYKASLIAWALSARKLTFAEYEGIVSAEPDWWIKKRSVIALASGIYGVQSYVAVALALRVGRPVRCVLDREAEQTDSGGLVESRFEEWLVDEQAKKRYLE